MNWIRSFDEVGMADVALVGGKNAPLGEMRQAFSLHAVLDPEDS
jgi:phosphoenolpyruvate synthase/pyruvate phosphate dikinase